MKIDIFDILDGLEKVLPILGTMTGNPALGTLAAQLLNMGEEEVQRRMSATGRPRAEVLADAAATYPLARQANADLKKLGHEND